MLDDESGVGSNTCLLVKQMQGGATVGIDLSDLRLNVSLVERSTVGFEQIDSLTKVLDCFLVGLLAELVVTLLFESGDLLLDFLEVGAIRCVCGGS